MTGKPKIFTRILAVIMLTGAIVVYAMWHKKHRDVEDEYGIAVTASQLVKDYQANENEANKKYLDKAIQVTGAISKLEKNQDGNTTVLLSSDDAFTGVYCTLKEKNPMLKESNMVTIKGLCSGMLTDVRLREAIVVK